MTRVFPRTNFHSSQLLRCLSDLAISDIAEPGEGFAEKLGMWIHFIDAITLSTVLNDDLVAAPEPDDEGVMPARTAFERVQASMMVAIAKSFSEKQGRTHNELPGVPLELPMEFGVAYMPYRRFYEAHQRDMAMQIQPLRVNMRAALAQVSSRHGKLAQLDATLETVLRERETRLLGKVPVLLRRRFEQLFNDHSVALAERGAADNPAIWDRAGGWLARFCQDMHKVLLAEMELRLQPALGLLESIPATLAVPTTQMPQPATSRAPQRASDRASHVAAHRATGQAPIQTISNAMNHATNTHHE